ncbi:unnamed protein product [Lactuca saligna]|uniref:Uncharacterized protein n=1 Tax=Lactuca saligna TaxID=75948 RepID=A0AA36DXZ6_LACSI|nr:unnamed protein product [Lactuca saligna]
MKVLNFRSICKQREMESKDHLNKFEVGSVPTLYYIPDFISDSDQKLLLNQEGLSMKKVLCLKSPHQDGSAYFPVVAILSLGSPVIMDFTPHSTLADTTSNIQETSHGNLQNYPPFSIALMPRSLLVFKDTTYSGDGCTWIPVIENFTVHHDLKNFNGFQKKNISITKNRRWLKFKFLIYCLSQGDSDGAYQGVIRLFLSNEDEIHLTMQDLMT